MTPQDLATNPLTRAQSAIAEIVKEISEIKLVTFGFVPDGAAAFPQAFTELGASEIIDNNANAQRIEISLIVLVGSMSSQQAQQDLNGLVSGAGSIANTIHADQTLRGTVYDARVTRSDPLNLVQLAGYEAWGRSWTIEILTEA